MSDPMTKQDAPASASAPWLITNGSAAKNAAARSMSSTPAALTGNTWSPKRPTMSEIAPSVPGKISPGLKSSTVIPSVPSESSRTMMLGSMIVSRIRFQTDIRIVSISAPAV
jgi:hypothetical protein